jgi:ABC-type Co2+ transport system permease subunit
MYTLPAAVASDLVKSTGNSAAVSNTMVPIVLKVGALYLIAGGAPAVGSNQWSMWYVALDDGAYVTAA